MDNTQLEALRRRMISYFYRARVLRRSKRGDEAVRLERLAYGMARKLGVRFTLCEVTPKNTA